MNNDDEYAANWAYRALAQLQDAQRELADVWIRGRDHTTGNIGDEVVKAIKHTQGALSELQKIYAITGRPASEIAGDDTDDAKAFDPDEPTSPVSALRCDCGWLGARHELIDGWACPQCGCHGEDMAESLTPCAVEIGGAA
ncbi:hypothetical protein KAJ83_09565 [Marivibrio halodurans]|uniref:Uncharacterized protein n=1 Tax=Marivibrio halodurans TaxID=2039722 RepID=A0A8J7RZ62_9PROT|nr:hypothetical protein [Marivibrio halodurans]MBP5857255.1 hypothetical protein [Marivibrio halodurans]